MTPNYFAELFAYTRITNARLWECAMTLSDEGFLKPLPYSIGSIFKQLSHTMGVEFWWFHYLRTGELKFLAKEELEIYAKDRMAFRARWDANNAVNQAYLDQLTPEELLVEVHPEFWDEDERPIKKWEAIMQVLFHSMDHRSQTLAMLHSLGAPTIEQDFLDYMHTPQAS
jgi:uncharacterized damage-inducible protein DinB